MSKGKDYTSIFDAPVYEPENKVRKNKKTVTLIAAVLAVCVLGAAAFAAVKYLPKKAEMTDEGIAVISTEKSDITEITCTFEGETISLKRNGEIWLYGDTDVTDNSSVQALIGRCAEVMSVKTVATADDDYGFSEPYATVSVKSGRGDYTITFGNTGFDGNSRYFKISGAGDGKVYLMLTTIAEEYNISVEDLQQTEEDAEETAGAESDTSTSSGTVTASSQDV